MSRKCSISFSAGKPIRTSSAVRKIDGCLVGLKRHVSHEGENLRCPTYAQCINNRVPRTQGHRLIFDYLKDIDKFTFRPFEPY
jgi:hypothetical protein